MERVFARGLGMLSDSEQSDPKPLTDRQLSHNRILYCDIQGTAYYAAWQFAHFTD